MSESNMQLQSDLLIIEELYRVGPISEPDYASIILSDSLRGSSSEPDMHVYVCDSLCCKLEKLRPDA